MLRRALVGLGGLAATVWVATVVLDSSSRPTTPVGVAAQDGNVVLSEPVGVSLHNESVRRELYRRLEQSDTYLPAMLAESDSLLRRWDVRLDDPLRVYLEPSSVDGYTPASDRAVRDAFARWTRVAQIPVSFVYVRSADEADVIVKWVDQFPMERAGQAEVLWQMDGWLRRGTLTLATHTFDGRLLSSRAVFTVALHEIGHLLGLGHSDDPRDVMYPTTSVHDLTSRDRRTAMLLYSFPPGSLKD
jgi:Matrixin